MKRFLLLSLLVMVTVPIVAETKTTPVSSGEALGLPSAAAVGAAVTGPRAEIEALWAAGQKKEAQKRLDQWIEKEKSTPWPWVMSAKMQCEQKRYKKCASLAEVALAKSADCSEAYYWKGRGLEGQNKTLDAANEYRAALSGPNKFPEAQKDLDRVQAELGSTEQTQQ